jgi:rhamnosyltransferase
MSTTQIKNIEGARPKVIVLMATYNGVNWLGEQVDSILSQQDVDVHVVIGDDCSRDGTAQLIADRWGSDTRVQLSVWKEGSGSAGANFRRLFRTVDTDGYDFVALADQDDIWEPEKLASAIAKIEQASVHGYSCAVRSFWPDGREKVLPQVPVARHADFLFEGAGQGCTFVVQRELFARVQTFCTRHSDETESLHYHDWLIYLLARAWGFKWYFDQHFWVNYRQHGGNEIGSRGGVRSLMKRLELIRNGWFSAQIGAALKLFAQAGHNDSLIRDFSQNFSKSDSVMRRAQLCWFVVLHGRRRFSDRVVLAASAVAGWI